MNKLQQTKFRYEILILFVLIEVLLFDSNNSLKLFITLLEYVFVGYSLVKNIEIGLMYLISFTILTIGIGNYPDLSNLPCNFWGIRLFGFSFNILFSSASLIYVLFKKKRLHIKFEENVLFFILFFIYSLIIGTLSLIFSINYADDFISDLMTYAPLFIYIYFLSNISLKSTKDIIKHSISATIILIFLSSILNKKTQYGNDSFVLQNGLSFILPIALFVLKDFYSKLHFTLLVICLIALIALQEYIIGGKSIILIVVFLIWIGYYYKKWRIYLFIFGVFTFSFFSIISTYILEFYSGNVVAFKFSQVFDVFLIADIDKLSWTLSSIGNLIAEGRTILYHLFYHPFFLIFGKGFGGSIPDIFGYLSQWVGDGMNGYTISNQVRNNYYKMHLPIYEIILKSGIIGLFLYSRILVNSFLSKNKYSILYFCQLFFVFYVSKEFFLVTLVFLKLMNETNIEEYNSLNNDKLKICNTHSV